MGRYRFGQPDVSADHRVVADDRVSAENRAAGVNDDVVLDGRMPLDAREFLLDEPRAERDALIKLHVPADDGRLADDDARSVVDVESRTDRGARVNVDAGLAVGVFRYDARQHRNVQPVHHVREPVYHNGVEARIAQDHFLGAIGGRVAALVKVRVFHQPRVDQRNLGEEPGRQPFAAAVHAGAERRDDMQEILLQVLPAQVHLLERHAPPVADREKQVRERVDESARGDLRRHFAVKYLRHSVQAVREILDRVGHGVCVFREKSGYRLRLPCVSLLTYRSISCRSFRYRKQSLYCSLSSSTSRTLRSELL